MDGKTFLVAVSAVMAAGAAVTPRPMCRLEYNRAGTCDLKVGLWAFPWAMDYNGDGVRDVVVGCPDTPFRGYFVFEGTKEGVFRPCYRVGDGTDAWCTGMSVVDGRTVICGPKGFYWDLPVDGFREGGLFTPNPSFNPQARWNEHGGGRGSTVRLQDVDGDGAVDMVEASRGKLWWRRNLTGLNGPGIAFGDEQPILGADHKPISCGRYAMMEDFDGDGDLDVIANRSRDGFAYYENVGTRTAPRYAPMRVVPDTSGQPLHMFLCMITPSAVDWDGDGRMDILCGDEDGRVAVMRNTGRLAADRTPVFEPPRYLRQYNKFLACGVLAAPAPVDWDGDGDIDIICGNSAGETVFIENLSGPGVECPSWAEPKPLSCEGAGGIPAEAAQNDPIRIMAGEKGSIQGPGEAKWGYTSPTVCDWDGDGLPDVLVNTVWGYVYWHRNVGTRTAPRLGGAQPIEVEWEGEQPLLPFEFHHKPVGKGLLTQWRTTPATVDLNGDGLPDLVMLDTMGYLAYFERAIDASGKRVLKAPRRMLMNADTNEPLFFSLAGGGKPFVHGKSRMGASGRRKFCFVDWDGDGKLDIVVNEGVYHQGSSVCLWRQTGRLGGRWYFTCEGSLSKTPIEGHSCAPAAVDFNADGVPDLLVGGEDGCFYYQRNPRLPSRPPTLFVNEDAWVFFARAHDRNVTNRADMVQELERYIDGFAKGGKVTDIAFSVNFIRMAYPSKVNDPNWSTVAPDGKVIERGDVHRRYYDLGVDPYAVQIARCRERGIRPWVSMRMNDVHFITSSNTMAVSCTAWRQHPEWRRVPDVEPAGSNRPWDDFAFNYSLADVRDYQFAIFKEIVDRYDADGYELDWLRWINHLAPGREREDARFLTEFIARCRAYTRQIAKKRGHEIRLACRVASDIRAVISRGMEVETWARQDLVDLIAACNFYSPTDFGIEFGRWRTRIHAANPRTLVLPGTCDALENEPCRLDWAALCGWTDRLYGEGADGFYVYNASYLDAETLGALKERGFDRVASASSPRRYISTCHDVSPEPRRRVERQIPVALDRAKKINVEVATPPQANEVGEVVIALSERGVPAPRVTLNGATPSGAAVSAENAGRYGDPARSKVFYRYRFPTNAIKKGRNDILVEPPENRKVVLRWAEISVARSDPAVRKEATLKARPTPK
ncbi:MAG: VCBS repeat-containing protein [Kiritimatiellae bacterium]|nr:VCBS repeat-containing protein [Kiritimatiellia bacterium]